MSLNSCSKFFFNRKTSNEKEIFDREKSREQIKKSNNLRNSLCALLSKISNPMEINLDVEVVGREFVRQYYTVLNQRPDCLHQFFTQDSSFVHGGVEKPGEEQPAAKGQATIHQKILALDFRDCHTKIRQVDCQKTIGNAVLVQVSGELSNNGEPMRRFMQSFVLVQQAPKKFYVHNDVFRYQDEVFHDCDTSGDDQMTDDVKPDESIQNSSSHEVQEVAPEDLASESLCDENNAATYNYMPEVDKQEASVVATSQPEIESAQIPVPEPEEPEAAPVPETKEPEIEPVKEKASPVVEAGLQLPSQKPFSWASLASKNAGPSGSPAVSAKPQATIKPERKTEAATTTPAPQPPRAPRPSRPSTGTPNNEAENKWVPVEGDDSNKPSVMIPDNQQLFVGNLPHNCSDTELQEMFEKFGTVIDIKINRKGGFNKDLPNFGFIAFDNTEAVAKALKARPIMLHGKRRINIEEKKDQSELGSRRGPPMRPRGGFVGRGSFAGRPGRGGANSSRTSAEAEQ